MSFTFYDFTQETERALSLISIERYYEAYLQWISATICNKNFNASEILFQLKIIHDLVIYNLDLQKFKNNEETDIEESINEKRKNILSFQSDPTLSSSLQDALKNEMPSPLPQEVKKKYFLAKVCIGILFFGSLTASFFVPVFLMLPVLAASLGLAMVPSGIMISRELRNIDLGSFNKRQKKYLISGVVGLISLALLSAAGSGLPRIGLMLGVMVFSLTVFSITSLVMAYIRRPFYVHQAEILKEMPSFNRALVNLMTAEPSPVASELKKTVNCTMLAYLSLQGKGELDNADKAEPKLLSNTYFEIKQGIIYRSESQQDATEDYSRLHLF